VLGHGLAVDHAVLIVVSEGKGVLGLGTLKGDGGDIRIHSVVPLKNGVEYYSLLYH
jgi:hypothetical protein